MDLFSEAFMWVGLICGWSLACGLGLIIDWDFISEHFRCFHHFRCFRHFRHSAVSPCPCGVVIMIDFTGAIPNFCNNFVHFYVLYKSSKYNCRPLIKWTMHNSTLVNCTAIIDSHLSLVVANELFIT